MSLCFYLITCFNLVFCILWKCILLAWFYISMHFYHTCYIFVLTHTLANVFSKCRVRHSGFASPWLEVTLIILSFGESSCSMVKPFIVFGLFLVRYLYVMLGLRLGHSWCNRWLMRLCRRPLCFIKLFVVFCLLNSLKFLLSCLWMLSVFCRASRGPMR